MRVEVYDLFGGKKELVSICDLRECYPDQLDECERAHAALERDGEYREGGGAAEKFLLVKVED